MSKMKKSYTCPKLKKQGSIADLTKATWVPGGSDMSWTITNNNTGEDVNGTDVS